MTKEQVYEDIERTLGLVPSFIKLVPEATLELEWRLFKRLQLDDGAVPCKYRELIGLGVAAVTRCRYCSLYHTEVGRLFGATEAEIEEAVHFAKSSAGWSTYINGMQLDYEQFRRELADIIRHVRRAQAAEATKPAKA
jgi:AhpD family alkylhydroperoxidase